MRILLSACSLVLAMGFSQVVFAGTNYDAQLPPGAVQCSKWSVMYAPGVNGLGDDLSKLLAVLGNRCSNSGKGNGLEMQQNSDTVIYKSGAGSEAGDLDPGKSGAHNKAGKK